MPVNKLDSGSRSNNTYWVDNLARYKLSLSFIGLCTEELTPLLFTQNLPHIPPDICYLSPWYHDPCYLEPLLFQILPVLEPPTPPVSNSLFSPLSREWYLTYKSCIFVIEHKSVNGARVFCIISTIYTNKSKFSPKF